MHHVRALCTTTEAGSGGERWRWSAALVIHRTDPTSLFIYSASTSTPFNQNEPRDSKEDEGSPSQLWQSVRTLHMMVLTK